MIRIECILDDFCLVVKNIADRVDPCLICWEFAYRLGGKHQGVDYVLCVSSSQPQDEEALGEIFTMIVDRFRNAVVITGGYGAVVVECSMCINDLIYHFHEQFKDSVIMKITNNTMHYAWLEKA